jgi:nicotinate-nucleotide pyrophosphorylase (carboxylating)
LGRISSNPVAYAVKLAKQKYPELKVEVEVEDLQQLDWAIEAGADVVLLDNMSIDMIRDAVKQAAGRVQLEASGGITLANVREVAEAGVDYISVGALTHSAPAVDIGMDFE